MCVGGGPQEDPCRLLATSLSPDSVRCLKGIDPRMIYLHVLTPALPTSSLHGHKQACAYHGYHPPPGSKLGLMIKCKDTSNSLLRDGNTASHAVCPEGESCAVSVGGRRRVPSLKEQIHHKMTQVLARVLGGLITSCFCWAGVLVWQETLSVSVSS